MEKVLAAQQKAQQEVCGPNGLDLGPVKFICNEQEVTSIGFRKGPKTIREILLQAFKNYGGQEFMVFNDRRYTFNQARQEVLKVCGILKALGVKKHDRVALAGRNSDYWCLAYLATTMYGATCVPLNALWKTDELAYALDDSGTTVVFCDEERFGRLKPLMDSEIQALHAKIVVIEAESSTSNIKYGNNVFELMDLMKKTKPLSENELPSDASSNDIACIMYTSGTTGFPKGVCQTHNNITQALRVTMVLMVVMDAAKKAMQVPGQAAPAELPACIICPVPLFHVTALYPIFMVSLVVGRKIVLMSRWSTSKALELIQKEKPTMWIGVPTMLQDLMEHPNYSKTDVSSLKILLGGGAPTPSGQVKKIREKFGPQSLPANAYGLTETISAVCNISGDEYIERPTSCGKALPICDMRIIDLDLADKGRFVEMPRGSIGEMVLRSPMVMTGYYNKKDKTNEAIVSLEGEGNGWFRTGDIAKIDKDGYIFILDRAKDIIIRGGENISCAEVESALFHHSDVMECAVYGIKDERLGEIVGCTICLKENSPSYNMMKKGCSSDQEIQVKKDILSHATKNIAKFKIPELKHTDLTLEILPRGATGKILKREMRDAANEKLKSSKL